FKFVSGGEPATSSFFGKLGFVVLVASLLPFFLGPHREGLIDLGGAAAADFLFEFFDALPGRFELPLEGHDDVDQAIDADASRGDILLKLLVGVHAKNLSNRQPRSCPSFENSVNGPIFCRGPCVRDLTATVELTNLISLRSFMMPLFTAFLLPLMGCSSSEEKAWQQGYDLLSAHLVSKFGELRRANKSTFVKRGRD